MCVGVSDILFYFFQIQLKEIEEQAQVGPTLAEVNNGRARSVELVDSIEIQTDESFLRNCKSAADIHQTNKQINKQIKLYSKDTIDELPSDRSFHSDIVSLV